ncbi:NAD(P)-dependent oxidoreductase [Clostridium perfringens]|nr:NAD(P)-dependent oxidoreductase [Clostridium perfringens]
MKILITGAGGWLGSELTKRLLEQGNDVRALVLFSSDKLKKLKSEHVDNLEIIEGDICDKEIVNKSLEDIEIVYHLAAKVHYMPKNKNEEEEFFKINTGASENIFNLSLKHKVKRVIFYSSVSVYGESDNIVTTATPKRPVTPYAKSKFMAEEAGLNLFKEKGLPITIIEPATVYGGDDVGNFEKLKSLINKGIVARFGDGQNKKTIIYYKDLINMTINIAKDKNAIGKVIICGTESISLNNILDVLKNSSNKKSITLKFSNGLTKLMVKVLNLIGLSLTKKIARQIVVLSSNNEYSLNSSENYIDKYIRFRDYYN